MTSHINTTVEENMPLFIGECKFQIIDSTHKAHDNHDSTDSMASQLLHISSNSSNVYKCKRLIPDTIINYRYQSLDHRQCLDPNGKGFGFIPFNDLMTWASVPDIIEAQAMIRRSAMPKFMKVRILVQTQLNVAAWKNTEIEIGINN